MPGVKLTVPEGFIVPPGLTTVPIVKSLVLDETDEIDVETWDDFELDELVEDCTEEADEIEDATDEEPLDKTELAVDELVDGVGSSTPPPQADNRPASARTTILLHKSGLGNMLKPHSFYRPYKAS
ncbi:hypothetical protein GCM10011613_03710 [Cellvibrio zantedeschiae]|uniref:Uncharacterized protein n=1 Tax=Cellvibrio zantedeschiae TaxID=1237077 RepID=A0ABQ3ARC8_9GAMM|nr:hypothetical protein GCM10011613_03710 [Cellvibrio zantedeschiae]